MPKYKILQGEGLDSQIEKTDFATDFSLKDLKINYEKVKKMIVELTAKKGVEDATMVNIETNHEIVKTLIPETIAAVYLWQEAKNRSIECQEKLDTLNDYIKEYEAEFQGIKEQTGISIEDDAAQPQEETK